MKSKFLKAFVFLGILATSITTIKSPVFGQLPQNKLLTNSSLYDAPKPNVESRWVSPENPTGEKGKGGLTNKGAKGNAFFIISPGEKKELFDIKGAGIIERMWLSGSIAVQSVLICTGMGRQNPLFPRLSLIFLD